MSEQPQQDVTTFKGFGKQFTDEEVKAMGDQQTQELEKRISNYLSSGGLFNPESMEHEKVRDLIMDCRDALAAANQAAYDKGYEDCRKLWKQQLAEQLKVKELEERLKNYDI
jgi:hypothetical protein